MHVAVLPPVLDEDCFFLKPKFVPDLDLVLDQLCFHVMWSL